MHQVIAATPTITPITDIITQVIIIITESKHDMNLTVCSYFASKNNYISWIFDVALKVVHSCVTLLNKFIVAVSVLFRKYFLILVWFF